VNTYRITRRIDYRNSGKLLQFLLVILFGFLLGGKIQAQEPYYYHTIHSHGLSLIGGRTARLNYLYQTSHNRQVKLSGIYVYDAYHQGRNRIRANVYIGNLYFQYHLIHTGDFFLNGSIGAGGYYLSAKDLLKIKHTEWQFDLSAGLEAEFFIVRNQVALTVDYDVLYLPWSKIYQFLHIPTAGVTIYFF